MHAAIERLVYGRPSPVPQTRDLPFARTVLAGRILLALLFVLSGIQKFAAWSQTAAFMEAQGVPAAPLFLALAALIEIGGALAIMTGTFTRPAALLLFLYLIPVTLVFHNFWALEGAERQVQLVNFLKNLSIMGGLLLVVGYGAGRVSVDDKIKPRGPSPAGSGSRA